ncbi:DUF2236 domain-containing protein [Sabulilitoribacter multivorans]|uniref:DUF2236 domain-containing protein n=1 Tax=Flaviramulus multivorans TaxID=1304750 RepID=A0ABS9IIR1_9FLAO|nr:oxygenase MpaB family protein [Flaviramulus multivorans]MCF7560436.1 DUF2236 domain-containing protein [Flaviramulus multivorans]
MKDFVDKHSIVRNIWGNSDTILLIFAGASAEFALNKAVDWLYFTGQLPKDPLSRLFSTVSYARQIVFSDDESALKAIQKINTIHTSVENKRGKPIPDWAYKDVLYMLIDYSLRSYELLERPLSYSEKQEVINVFTKVGKDMGLNELPKTYSYFDEIRKQHLKQDLNYGAYTKDLYKQYRKHLGIIRYKLLLETQKMLLPKHVRELLKLRKTGIMYLIIPVYKWCRYLKIDKLLKILILPTAYQKDIKALNIINT